MDLIQSKEIILNEINKLFETYQIKEIDSSQKLNELNNLKQFKKMTIPDPGSGRSG